MSKIKVRVDIDSREWHGSSTETLWADVREDNLRKIDNIPFLAFGLSYGDIIQTETHLCEIEDFQRIVHKGGHSTYRLILQQAQLPMAELEELSGLGCLYEIGKFGSVTLVAVSVPPEVNIDKVYLKFRDADDQGLWDFEEANFEH